MIALSRWLRAARSASARPYILIVALMLTCIWIVSVVRSADGYPLLNSLLFLPLVFAILMCRLEFVLTMGVLVSAAMLGIALTGQTAQEARHGLSMHVYDTIVEGLLINAIAILGGIHMRQTRLHQNDLNRRLKEADYLLNLSLWISTSNSLEDAVDIVLSVLRPLQPYHTAALFLLDESQTTLIGYGAGDAIETLNLSRLAPEEAGISDDVRVFETIYVADTGQPSELPRVYFLPGVRSFVLVPLYSSGTHLAGLLYVGFDQKNALDSQKRHLLQEFALRIAFPLLKMSQQERLQGMAYTDAMTGLMNYRAFKTQLEEELARSARYNHALSLLILDLDFFKRVNDHFGHPVGDRMLAHVATILRASLRDTDLPARYGGEEFVALCPETDAQSAHTVAERIRQAVQNTPYTDSEVGTIPITVSIGVASSVSGEADGPALIQAADAALYAAKRAGRNRVVQAASEMEAIVTAAEPRVALQGERAARTLDQTSQ